MVIVMKKIVVFILLLFITINVYAEENLIKK